MIDIGNGFILRRLEAEDADAIWQFKNSKSLQDQLVGFRLGMSHCQVVEWIAFHNARRDEIILAVSRSSDSKCVGHVGLYEVDERNRRGELGVLIGTAEVRGLGVGKSACRAILDIAFFEFGLHSVYLHVIEDNSIAIKLYTQLGFRKDGVIREAVFKNGVFKGLAHYTLLADEWRASNFVTAKSSNS